MSSVAALDLRIDDPLEQARKIGALADPLHQYSGYINVADLCGANFRFPQSDELFRYLDNASRMADPLHSYLPVADTIARMQRLSTPWVRPEDLYGSLNGMADLYALGRDLAVRPPYVPDFTESLRAKLGDWRDGDVPSQDIAIDAIKRTSFYLERGFQRSLADFPTPAFAESLRIAGFRDRMSEPKEDSSGELPDETQAFQNLVHLERELRIFIRQAMTSAFGDDWWKQRLPADFHAKWLDKQTAAVEHGQPHAALIDFADFTDYLKIIELKSNWRQVFKPVFNRQEDIRESLVRLYPLRTATMHSRTLTHDDQMLLIVETRRIRKAIQRPE